MMPRALRVVPREHAVWVQVESDSPRARWACICGLRGPWFESSAFPGAERLSAIYGARHAIAEILHPGEEATL